MAGPNVDISIRIEVLNPRRQFPGGTVEIEFKPPFAGQAINIKASRASADASKDIDAVAEPESCLMKLFEIFGVHEVESTY